MTSILSCRWLKLWVHNPVLNFDAPVLDVVRVNKRKKQDYVKSKKHKNVKSKKQNYVNWVNSVLRLHKGHYLKDFKISCSLGNHHQKDIDSWLEFALARKVQNLELNFLHPRLYVPDSQDGMNYVFPLNLSHEKAAAAASVYSNRGGSSCFSTLDLKSLKSLSFKLVDVTGEAINFVLLSCPYLERLEVAGTDKLVNLVISDPTLVLKYLQIRECYHLEVLNISNFNLVSLHITACGDLTLTDLPMLVELSIFGTSDRFRHFFSQASSCHSQLEALTLQTWRLKDISQLFNLSQMTKLKRICIIFGVWSDESLTKLFSSMNSRPYLMEFVLKLCWYGAERTGRAPCKGEKCSMKCLKVFEFIGFSGRVSDVELIMHVVENADGLEKVIIHPSWSKSCFKRGIHGVRKARSVALQQFEGLKESIPSHVDLVIR